MELDLFGRTASKERYQVCQHLVFFIQVLLFLRSLHRISERSHGPWNDGNLLHRLRLLLKRHDKRMSHLVVCNNLFFFFAEDTVFLFLSGDDYFYSLKEV